MPLQVSQPFSTAAASSLQIVLRDAAVHLQRADRRDDHDGGSVSDPALRHLMSMNFSAPRSAPKPASVTT